MIPSLNDLNAVSAELMLVVAAGLLLLVRGRRFLPAAGALLAAAAGALRVLYPPAAPVVWGGALAVDSAAVMVQLFVLLAAALTFWVAGPYLERVGRDGKEFYSLILLATAGAMLMASAAHLLAALLALELMSIPLYVLCAYLKDVEISLESGLKYFVVGAFSAAVLTYGIALIYGALGGVSLRRIALSGPEGGPLFWVGLAMVLGGFFFKLALFPFHAWAPDVYQGAPTPVVGFLSVVPKAAVLVLLGRVAVALGQPTHTWVMVLGIVAVASQTYGNLVALVQADIKRMLAYSGIAHMGYALLGLAAAGTDGVAAVLAYVAAYIPMNIGAFAVVSVFSEREDEPHYIHDLAGQGWKRPVLSAALAVCLFSLTGIPPLVGFAAKFMVFKAVVGKGLYLLAVIGVLNSVISAGYYLRVVYTLYMKRLPEREPEFPALARLAGPGLLASLVVVVAGIWPVPIIWMALKAAAAISLG